MPSEDLVLGIDGGGSTTVAWLALADDPHEPRPLGVGQSGPSNPQSVGWEATRQSLGAAVEAAFRDAGRPPQQVRAACVALAGADRPGEQRQIAAWATQQGLAHQTRVVNDAPCGPGRGSSRHDGDCPDRGNRIPSLSAAMPVARRPGPADGGTCWATRGAATRSRWQRCGGWPSRWTAGPPAQACASGCCRFWA